MRPFTLLAVCCAAVVMTGCSTLSYYAQAVSGEVTILSSRRDINHVIDNPATPERVRAALHFVRRVRHFAHHALDLPNNGSYRTYVDLGRPYPVWVVYAAPPFSLRPVEWCYWFVGCAPYRGYFHKTDAQTFAAKLRHKGDDVYLGGAPAYSTLGWFADPVTSNMLHWPRPALAGLIFHELAHQLVYVDGAARFNESFADTVEHIGIKRWLSREHKRAKRKALRENRQARQAFQALIGKLRGRLKKIYSSSAGDGKKRRQKTRAFAWLKRRHKALEKRFGRPIYAAWFEHPENNASLAVLTTYDQYQPAFRRLLKCDGGHLEQFYADVRAIAKLDQPARRARLDSLGDGCGTTPAAR
jgi:predicted aminopeptidase